MASDTTDGSKTVKIGDKEVGLKDKSCFKTSTGDEAGSAAKKGVITSKNTGKVYFTSWSMDVKIEGENAVRHLDLTTNNHASLTGQTPPWPFIGKMDIDAAGNSEDPCAADKAKEAKACKDFKPHGAKDPCPPKPASPAFSKGAADKLAAEYLEDRAGAAECLAARRCRLQPYENTETGKGGCCDGQTGHHLVEASAFHIKGRGDGSPDATGENVKLAGCDGYDMKKAPCICVEGAGHGVGTHGLMHTFQSATAIKCPVDAFKDSSGGIAMIASDKNPTPKPLRHPATTLAAAQKSGAKAVAETFPESNCEESCIEAQLKAYHEAPPPSGAGIQSTTPTKAVYTCKPNAKKIAAAEASVDARKAKFDAIDASMQAAPGIVK